jgi:hypothetical protein
MWLLFEGGHWLLAAFAASDLAQPKIPVHSSLALPPPSVRNASRLFQKYMYVASRNGCSAPTLLRGADRHPSWQRDTLTGPRTRWTLTLQIRRVILCGSWITVISSLF